VGEAGETGPGIEMVGGPLLAAYVLERTRDEKAEEEEERQLCIVLVTKSPSILLTTETGERCFDILMDQLGTTGTLLRLPIQMVLLSVSQNGCY
jgi:hypothetical protein